MGLNEIGRDSVNSIYLVQDGEKRVFVNTAMIMLAPKNAKKKSKLFASFLAFQDGLLHGFILKYFLFFAC